MAGIDYAFQGIPATIPPGVAAFKFTNQAPKEHHEMVVLREHDRIHLKAKKLLRLPNRKLSKKVDFVGAASADPGQTDVTIAALEPGHYMVVCSQTVGGKKHGKAHWMKGMLAEFDVPSA